MKTAIALFTAALLLSFLLFGCLQQPPPAPAPQAPPASGSSLPEEDANTVSEDAGIDSSLSDLDALEAEAPELGEADINTSSEDAGFDPMLADLDALNPS